MLWSRFQYWSSVARYLDFFQFLFAIFLEKKLILVITTEEASFTLGGGRNPFIILQERLSYIEISASVSSSFAFAKIHPANLPPTNVCVKHIYPLG